MKRIAVWLGGVAVAALCLGCGEETADPEEIKQSEEEMQQLDQEMQEQLPVRVN